MKKGQRALGEVHVQVKGRNMAVPPVLHDQVARKMRRLDKYLDQLQVIEVELWTERTREAGYQSHVEVTARAARRTLRVTAEDSDMQAAIDETVDRLYRQLNRQKERLKSHGAIRITDAVPADSDDTGDALQGVEVEDGGRPPVIHVERLEFKPIFEEEAIEEMDSLGRSFYVFLNARDEQVNVVYRRADGSYGLIEPSRS